MQRLLAQLRMCVCVLLTAVLSIDTMCHDAQLVLGLVIFVQALLMCRDALRIGARKWLSNGWNVYEVVTWLGFFLILGMDIRTKRLVDDLHLDMASTDAYVDVWGTVFFFGIERDILAVVLLLLVVRPARLRMGCLTTLRADPTFRLNRCDSSST